MEFDIVDPPPLSPTPPIIEFSIFFYGFPKSEGRGFRGKRKINDTQQISFPWKI